MIQISFYVRQAFGYAIRNRRIYNNTYVLYNSGGVPARN
jgi:hypothetical protein